MPLTLHPHLKRQQVFDELYTDPADIIEDTLPDYSNPEEQSAKRRRIENIASQYLKGNVPVILSAGLRGPFGNGWKNPWAQTKKGKRRTLDRGKAVIDHESAVGGRRARPADAKRRTRSASRRSVQEQTLSSPETARAVDDGVEHFQESHTSDEIEVPAPTAPLAEEHDTSGATEFFSLGTARCIKSRSPMTDPFWLRRPESNGRHNMQNSTNSTIDHSPSRLRGTTTWPDQRGTLQLAAPKAPVGPRALPEKVAVPDDIRSSASASMVISSPVKPATHLEDESAHTSDLQTHQLETLTLLTGTSTLASEVHPAQVRSVAVSLPTPPSVPAHEMPPANSAPPACSPNSNNTTESNTLRPESQQRPTREAILQSAERLVDRSSASASSNSQRKQTEVATHVHGSKQQHQHNSIASASNSSAGFVYKKVGSTKWSISSAPRSKPRAVNFNSSPINKKGVSTSSKPSSQRNAVVDNDAAGTNPNRAPQSGERTESQRNKTAQEQQSLGSTYPDQQSDMSTQAAMLLAQLEFQESTYPISSPETQRP
jgi:hypothetical protein